jgi:hypothetical protein
MAKKPSVLDGLAKFAKTKKTWFEALPIKTQVELLEIRRLKQSGECTYSDRTIHRWVKDRGGRVAKDNLADWLHEKN